MDPTKKIFRVTLASQDVDAFLAECQAAQWYGFDTGERVMTDLGPDAEAVVVVDATPMAIAEVAIPQ